MPKEPERETIIAYDQKIVKIIKQWKALSSSCSFWNLINAVDVKDRIQDQRILEQETGVYPHKEMGLV